MPKLLLLIVGIIGLLSAAVMLAPRAQAIASLQVAADKPTLVEPARTSCTHRRVCRQGAGCAWRKVCKRW
jgi:hypothetical protein